MFFGLSAVRDAIPRRFWSRRMLLWLLLMGFCPTLIWQNILGLRFTRNQNH